MNKTIEQLAEEIYPKGNVHFVSGHMVDLNEYLKDAFISGAQSLQLENERLREAIRELAYQIDIAYMATTEGARKLARTTAKAIATKALQP